MRRVGDIWGPMETPTHHRAVALVLTLVLAMGVVRVVVVPRATSNRGMMRGPDAGGVASLGRRDSRVDPNTADIVALESLPGVGPALARRIVAVRQSGVVFRRAEDLDVVPGIGPRTIERLAPYLTFDSFQRADAGRFDRRVTGLQ